jgi:hypothetical protein
LEYLDCPAATPQQPKTVVAANEVGRYVGQEAHVELPTEPRTSPDDARKIVEAAFTDTSENPIDQETEAYQHPDSPAHRPQGDMTLLDEKNDIRAYIDEIHAEIETERKQDDFELSA